MSKYKKIMLTSGIMQKEVLTNVQRVDPRVDKSLLSKIVNDICLPTKPTLDSICKTLRCGVLDIYDPHEINLLPDNTDCAGVNAVATARNSRGGLSHGDNVYNLTVEIDRRTAERITQTRLFKQSGLCATSGRRTCQEIGRNRKKRESRRRCCNTYRRQT